MQTDICQIKVIRAMDPTAMIMAVFLTATLQQRLAPAKLLAQADPTAESDEATWWRQRYFVHVNKIYKTRPWKNGRLETRDQQDAQVTDNPASCEGQLIPTLLAKSVCVTAGVAQDSQTAGGSQLGSSDQWVGTDWTATTPTKEGNAAGV